MNFDVSEEDLKEDKDGGGDQSEEKKTFKEKLQAVQDVTAMVQNALGIVAHLAEGMIFFYSSINMFMFYFYHMCKLLYECVSSKILIWKMIYHKINIFF